MNTTSKESLIFRFFNYYIRFYLRQLIAREISSLTRYYDRTIQLSLSQKKSSLLLDFVQCQQKTFVTDSSSVPDLSAEINQRTFILLDGNFNHNYDVQGLLQELKEKMSRSSRVGVVIYSSYLRKFYEWANDLGLRSDELPCTFLTQHALTNLAMISGFEVVRVRPMAYIPLRLFGLGTWLNRFLQAMPLLRWMGFAELAVLRPVIPSLQKPSLSIIIPARNERGNIENALLRMPNFTGAKIEVIFVEGNSSDQTWEEIQRVIEKYQHRFSLVALKQTGKGKGDAVRLGFAHATCELVTILDADLTMPPELLPRFYDAYVSGQADFVNGSRLVYPMEGEAMRFLNWLGNIFFAKSLSWVLDANLGDSLCGTKLFSRSDYGRFISWRKDFGDFDPFGDFELLFPAAILGLGIREIPIRYLARTYGSTNIHRFRHGLMLFKMTWIGLCRIRMG